MKKLASVFCFVMLSFGCMACVEVEKCDIADAQCIQECTSTCANEDAECIETCVDLSTANREMDKEDRSDLALLLPQGLLAILFVMLKSGGL